MFKGRKLQYSYTYYNNALKKKKTLKYFTYILNYDFPIN